MGLGSTSSRGPPLNASSQLVNSMCLVSSLLTNNGFLQAGLHRQDVLLHQLHGARPLCNLFIEVIGQPGSLQLQLLGLERRLSRGLYRGREGGSERWKDGPGPRDLQGSGSRHGRVKCVPRQSRVSWLPVPQHEGQAKPAPRRVELHSQRNAR